MNLIESKFYNAHIYLIDDDESIRDTLIPILRSQNFRVEEFSTASEFLKLYRPFVPAVILLDMQLPDMIGINLQSKIKESNISSPIIFISGKSESTQIVEAFRYGAFDFLFKPFNLKLLLQTLNKALNFHLQLHKVQLQEETAKAQFSSLTPREKEISNLFAKGLNSNEIAEMLCISPNTIKIHKSRIFKKMTVTSEFHLNQKYIEAKIDVN